MALSIKTKQVAGVTALVGVIVIPLSLWYVSALVRRMLDESLMRADLIAKTTYQRAYDMVAGGTDLTQGLRTDAGLRSILQSTAVYGQNVLYVAIVDVHGTVIAHSLETEVGHDAPSVPELETLLSDDVVAQARAILTPGGQNFEVRLPLLLGTADQATAVGSIRVGISTLLIRDQLRESLVTQVVWVALALVGAIVMSSLLARVIVRPIHVIRSGLARLGRGELDVAVDLPDDSELGDLGDSFKAVSARLAAGRTELAGQRAALESVVEHLEDAVAFFGPDGTLLFANPAMRSAFAEDQGRLPRLFPAGHPYRVAVEDTFADRPASAPRTVSLTDGGERLILTHVVRDADGATIGVMLVSRNLAYLNQVQSTLRYSRKLAALSRLSAGIAHEVKNPLNATMIHLELLKMQLGDQPAAKEHLGVIAAQVRRLDEVVQGFLKFTRPEDLKLQPVALAPLVAAIMPVVKAEAEAKGVEVREEFPIDLPAVSADAGLLEQALLNLALNACQAMPNGGRLRIAASVVVNNEVEIIFEDTGSGIAPEHLARIFDLYFTTKEHGSGIGLSLVYRTIQLHDGEIEVQSTVGQGSTFRVRLHQA